MPRYFFNIHDGVDRFDDGGTVLDGIFEARLEAVRFAGRHIEVHAATVQFSEDWRLEAVDDRGRLLFRIELAMSQSSAIGSLCGGETVSKDRIVGLFQMSPPSLGIEGRDGARGGSPTSELKEGLRGAAPPMATPSFFERLAVSPVRAEVGRV